MSDRVRISPSSSSPGSSGPQSRVRGRPFKDGNTGRPPGSKNKTTKMLEELVEGEAPKLTRKLLELALGGDVRCLHYCLDRLLPKRRGRPLDLQLPKITGVHDVATAMAAISEGVSSGNVTAEEASHLAHFFKSSTDAIIANDFAVRLQKVEAVVNQKNSNNHP